MKTCSKCKYLRLSKDYITACNEGREAGKDVFYCNIRAGQFNPFETKRCREYRLSDEELYTIAEEKKKYYREHTEELERLHKLGDELRRAEWCKAEAERKVN